ncbi:hypothetical protein [Nocardia terpenica]|uniref:Uncharacterized protein n=1 Tax=Nocardia terpenica TaxID=455432 RepID=A0A291RCW6_9NOCA|nr:hypothetical protein [Nocardia terpenica]ATL65158.1 hypothetical protein CRH09_01830 [Nocardia terpenica]
MTSLSIRVYDDHLTVDAPYDPVFHDRADELGGTWIPETNTWRFALDDEHRVVGLARQFDPAENTGPAHELAIAQHDVESDHAPGVAGVNVHRRRADLLTRLDALLDEVVWIHTALRTLR